jgi:hypothetical protein
MKWQGGPIVAKGNVSGFRQLKHCTPHDLRTATCGSQLFDLENYWSSLPPTFSALVIYLDEEQWLDHLVFPAARSYGSSWIVLGSPELEAAWLADRGEDVFVRAHRQTGSTRRQSLSPSVRFEVLRLAGFTCRYCGRKAPQVELQVDHVIPVAKGGENALSNLVAACADCNLGKAARQIDQ